LTKFPQLNESQKTREKLCTRGELTLEPKADHLPTVGLSGTTVHNDNVYGRVKGKKENNKLLEAVSWGGKKNSFKVVGGEKESDKA